MKRSIKIVNEMFKCLPCMFLLCYSVTTHSQNSVSTEDKRWNINKYVWSHTNYKTGKNDKPVIDFNAIEHWISLGSDQDVSISPNGDYFAYKIMNEPYQSSELMVESVNKAWKQSFIEAEAGIFSADNKQYVFKSKNDLFFLKLGTKQIQLVKNIASWQQVGKTNGEWILYRLNDDRQTLVLFNLLNGKEKRVENAANFSLDKSGKWFACQISNASKDLLLYNLKTGKEERFESVTGYVFNEGGTVIGLKIASSDAGTELKYANLTDGSIVKIWSTTNSDEMLGSYRLDIQGKQVVFIVNKKSVNSNSIWYWKPGMESANMLVNDHSQGMVEGMFIQGDCSFRDNYIIFSLQKPIPKFSPVTDAVQVDIWSYKDILLQSSQANSSSNSKVYTACVHPEDSKVIHVNNANENLLGIAGDYALVGNDKNALYGDRHWQQQAEQDSIWLVSLQNGTRTLLKVGGLTGQWITKSRRYVLYFDLDNGSNYFSYDLKTGKQVNISAEVPAQTLGWQNRYIRNPEKPQRYVGVAGWLADDAGVLVYDNYDIWQLDLQGQKSPVNITNGYGRRNHIVFSIAGKGEDGQLTANGIPTLSPNTSLLLKSFNNINKQYGVFQMLLGTKNDPKLLYADNCELSLLPISNKENLDNSLDMGTPKPVRAAKVNKWIVIKQSPTEAPNYFLTGDFKTYQPLTNLQPQKAYNWLTAELHSFPQLDGSVSQGILYKPENFDSAKKYPVIVPFYATLTNLLNHYPTPGFLNAPEFADDPAWFVSHGYLVFLPDIYFTPGSWGPSVLNTIEGAGQYLRTLSYVDSAHLSVCGHSNSGRFGYYVLTHSNSFVAMSLGSGFCGTDLISGVLSLESNGKPRFQWAENGNWSGLGNLWSNKEVWLDHTAVLQADKVTSPLLLFHADKDGDEVRLAAELFAALWRLEKKVWWLEYNEGGHRLTSFKDIKDYTIRYTQFFDHYLKLAPAPKWMTNGIPYSLKGVESRYELDPSGNCGKEEKPCAICDAWNKQYKRNPQMFERPIGDWKLDDDIKKELEKEETNNYDKKMKGEEQRIQENNRKLRVPLK